MQQAFEDGVGEGGVVELGAAGESQGDGGVAGVEFVGVSQIQHALRGPAGGERGLRAFEEKPAARLVHPVPPAGPGEVGHADGIADDPAKDECREHGREVQRGERGAVIGGGAAPERAHVGGVGGAAKPVGGFDEERAEAAKAGGPRPGERGLAARLERAAGVARALAGAGHAAAPQSEPGFSGVPGKQSAGETEKIGKPANHREQGKLARRTRPAEICVRRWRPANLSFR